MDEVKVFEWSRKEGDTSLKKYEIGTGFFCQWGCDYEEFEMGPGNFSTAIVRMLDGTVKNVHAENIQFIQ
jgi:hypothetical protein